MKSLYPATIIHLDLADRFAGPSLDVGGRAAYVVFWWQGIPLGHYVLREDAPPMPAAQVVDVGLQIIAPAVGSFLFKHGFEAFPPEYPQTSNLSDPPHLEELVAMRDPLQRLAELSAIDTTAKLSVVICTRDRPESLDQCLQSLLACSPQPAEILIVDNCPTGDATRQLVLRYPQVRYVLEPQPGLDVARNAGIRHSHGEIVAFTDDDVTVHPDWVGRLAICFSDSQVMAATGLLLPAALETEAQWLFEQYWGFNRGYRILTYDSQYFEKLKPWGVPAWHVGAGANLAFRREVFDLVGKFDIRLDVGAAGCSGDSELWYRVLAAGLTCRYDPRITAFHYHREDMTALKRQLYYYMRGHSAALLIQFAKHRHFGNLVRLFFWLPLYYAKLIARGMRHGFHARHRMIPAEWAGCLSGVFFFLQHMRSSENH